MITAKMPLTNREEDIFAYILGYVVDWGYSPTRQEIATKFEMTPPGAQKFVQALADKGRIRLRKERGKERSNRNIIIIEREK